MDATSIFQMFTFSQIEKLISFKFQEFHFILEDHNFCLQGKLFIWISFHSTVFVYAFEIDPPKFSTGISKLKLCYDIRFIWCRKF